MTNVEAAIGWMASKQGRVSYSMNYRYGPNSYDCSSAVYTALQSAGWNTSANGRNTETMFSDLTALGWYELPRRADGGYDTKRGDIFIWGRRGHSAGAFGHTGFFVDPNNIIHCNFGYNGITVNNHDAIWVANKMPYCTVYRFRGYTAGNSRATNISTVKNPDPNAPRWVVESGDTLYKIAEYYYGKSDANAKTPELAKYNNIANQNAINVGQVVYIPGPLRWTVEPGDTWAKIDAYYGYDASSNWTKNRNPGKSMTVGTVLNIWD